ncbi:MAG: hypothetical protein EZS28_044033, partial [Streblomastix strix]
HIYPCGLFFQVYEASEHRERNRTSHSFFRLNTIPEVEGGELDGVGGIEGQGNNDFNGSRAEGAVPQSNVNSNFDWRIQIAYPSGRTSSSLIQSNDDIIESGIYRDGYALSQSISLFGEKTLFQNPWFLAFFIILIIFIVILIIFIISLLLYVLKYRNYKSRQGKDQELTEETVGKSTYGGTRSLPRKQRSQNDHEDEILEESGTDEDSDSDLENKDTEERYASGEFNTNMIMARPSQSSRRSKSNGSRSQRMINDNNQQMDHGGGVTQSYSADQSLENLGRLKSLSKDDRTQSYSSTSQNTGSTFSSHQKSNKQKRGSYPSKKSSNKVRDRSSKYSHKSSHLHSDHGSADSYVPSDATSTTLKSDSSISTSLTTTSYSSSASTSASTSVSPSSHKKSHTKSHESPKKEEIDSESDSSSEESSSEDTSDSETTSSSDSGSSSSEDSDSELSKRSPTKGSNKKSISNSSRSKRSKDGRSDSIQNRQRQLGEPATEDMATP